MHDIKKAKPVRRSYSAEFKAELVAACGQADVSVAGLDMQHGINAYLLHRWAREHEQLERHGNAIVPLSVFPLSVAPQSCQIQLQGATLTKVTSSS